MSMSRLIGIPSLALAVVIGVSACQKKTETELSMTDSTAMSAESPYPVEETPPAATTTPEPSTSSGSTTPAPSRPRPSTPAPPPAPRGTRVPSGTTFEVAMVTPASTKTSSVGDPIEARLLEALIVDGKVIAEKDASVRGTISEVKKASKSNDVEDRATLKFNFTTIETTGGEKTLHATVTNSEGKQLQAGSTSTRDKLILGGSTVAGAVIGKVAGKSTKSTIIGGVAGAAVGAGVVMAAKGYELEVPAGSKVTLRTDESMTVVTR